MQHEIPEDFVIVSGEQHSVRDFCELTANALGIKLRWEGKDLEERGLDQNGNVLICVDEA